MQARRRVRAVSLPRHAHYGQYDEILAITHRLPARLYIYARGDEFAWRRLKAACFDGFSFTRCTPAARHEQSAPFAAAYFDLSSRHWKAKRLAPASCHIVKYSLRTLDRFQP